MLRLDRTGQRFHRLETTTMPDAGLRERGDLQQMICNSWDAFCEEIGIELLLVGQEVTPTDFAANRVDVLAIDREGAAVIVELKRGNDRYHLLQALAYAGMVSQWESGSWLRQLASTTGSTPEDAESEFGDFLDDPDSLNREQHLVLIAEAFDYEVLVAVEWLSEQHGLDIRCYRIDVATSEGQEVASFACIYPPQGITDFAIRRRRRDRRGDEHNRWNDWGEALVGLDNEVVRAFYEQELSRNQENRLPRRQLFYRVDGKRRWWMKARQKLAYAWQYGRFEGDLDFWKQRLSQPDEVKPVAQGSNLRMFLVTREDFSRFKQAVTDELSSVEFIDHTNLSDE